jgi:restriction system protein
MVLCCLLFFGEACVTMAPIKTALWGIRAGATGDADSLFLTKGVIALGLPEIGDLNRLEASLEAIKAALATEYPERKSRTIAKNAGLLLRFHQKIAANDFVVYPSMIDRHVHIGRIVGPYIFDCSMQSNYPHRRKVNWLTRVPRTRFSRGALYAIGAALALFQIRNYADEFWSATHQKHMSPRQTHV